MIVGDNDGDGRAKNPSRLTGVRVREFAVLIKSDTGTTKKGIGVRTSQNLKVDGSDVQGSGECEREMRSGNMRYIYKRPVSH
jgi:hypothetical protein